MAMSADDGASTPDVNVGPTAGVYLDGWMSKVARQLGFSRPRLFVRFAAISVLCLAPLALAILLLPFPLLDSEVKIRDGLPAWLVGVTTAPAIGFAAATLSVL